MLASVTKQALATVLSHELTQCRVICTSWKRRVTKNFNNVSFIWTLPSSWFTEVNSYSQFQKTKINWPSLSECSSIRNVLFSPISSIIDGGCSIKGCALNQCFHFSEEQYVATGYCFRKAITFTVNMPAVLKCLIRWNKLKQAYTTVDQIPSSQKISAVVIKK